MADQVLPGTQTMSSSTVANIITRARSLLNEASASFWSNDELMAWINDAILVISAHVLPLGQTEDITITADTLEYDIATLDAGLRYVAAVAAIYQPGAANEIKGLSYKGPEEIGSGNAAGTVPNHFYLVNGKIGLWPIQAAGDDGVGNTVRVYLAEIADAVTATTDTIPLPAIYDTPLLHYVVAMALFKDEKYDQARVFMALFDGVVQRYRVDFLETGEDD